ncbi:MAG: response regulator transcription factor [Bacilli bacterium]|nr:response regulator transcription factor [Bacilli bacterium]
MKLLIVEDHIKINSLLAKFARQDGHTVKQSYSAEEALGQLKKQDFDVILTDLMLPDMQGEELIETIRDYSDVYIMVISAKTETEDRIDCLTLGADDFVVKPFSVEEVMLKLRNVSRRYEKERPVLFSFNQKELTLSVLDRRVTFRGNPVSLTAYEYDVLYYLMSHPKQVFSRDDLILTLFEDSDAFDRVIDAYIKNIRKKLNEDPKNPKYIKTVFRQGYQFVGELDD